MKRESQTLLLVEDDACDALLVEQALSWIQAEPPVHIARNGAEALEYLESRAGFCVGTRFELPSMIITDLNMPCMDGLTLLEKIGEHRDWRIVPIIVLSSAADPLDVRKAYELGASSYFTKPIGLERLGGLLRRVLDYWAECEVPGAGE